MVVYTLYANWFVACTSVSWVMISWAILFLIKISAVCEIYIDYDPQFVINPNLCKLWSIENKLQIYGSS